MRKIIIFDLDNTFYNYQNSHSSALRAVFSFQNEFDDYKWVSYWYPLSVIISFKENVYFEALNKLKYHFCIEFNDDR